MDNIQKYFYLICFTGYLREQAKLSIDAISDEERKLHTMTGGKSDGIFYPKVIKKYVFH